MTEIMPLLYFSHAELKTKENLNANIEYTTDLTCKRSSSGLTKPKQRLKLTIQDDNMSYEAVEEEDQPFMIGKVVVVLFVKITQAIMCD